MENDFKICNGLEMWLSGFVAQVSNEFNLQNTCKNTGVGVLGRQRSWNSPTSLIQLGNPRSQQPGITTESEL